MDRKSQRVAVPAERSRGGRPVILVLGCQPVVTAQGRLTGALGRRLAAARAALEASERRLGVAGWLLVSGGRTWRGVVEADTMRDELVRSGVPASSVVRERCSLTTGDNARLSAELLRRFELAGCGPVALVTCEWHMARAAALFEREGVQVDRVPVPSPRTTALSRIFRAGREWVSGLRVSRQMGGACA
jgi:uncharacterized SAM-binding protein YcdF (DUF218 family)